MSEAVHRFDTTRASPDTETLVEVENLKKYYGSQGRFGGPPVKAVDGVNFTIQRGETLGLVGESGSGKTTLGRTLVQLETATEGTISFDGSDVTTLSGKELKSWRKNAQIVFQDPESSLNHRLTVGEIIREPLDVHDWNTAEERREKVRDLLSSVGLQPEHYYRYPHQFSGGQRQRIGIARALALEPKFIVLDEPVSALDASVQAKILNLLEDLQDEFDLTYLFIAHDLSVVRHICDRVAVMYLGKIMEIGETEELYTDPANPYTISLLSAIPDPDPTSDTARITLPGTPPSPRDPPKGCQFSTRCPAKIRPDPYPNLDEDVWDAIERLREAIRERSQIDLGPVALLRRRLGLFSKFDDIEETVEDLFADVDAPDDVEKHVATATTYVTDGYPEKARTYMREEFDAYPNLDEDVWDAIERLREAIRERSRIDLGPEALLRRRLGLFSKFDDIEETVEDLFADVDAPDDVEKHVATAAAYVMDGYPGKAREYMREEFDSVCDTTRPDLMTVSETGRMSYCHRHEPEHEEVDAVLSRRSDAG